MRDFPPPPLIASLAFPSLLFSSLPFPSVLFPSLLFSALLFSSIPLSYIPLSSFFCLTRPVFDVTYEIILTTIQYNTVQYSTVQCSTVNYTIQYVLRSIRTRTVLVASTVAVAIIVAAADLQDRVVIVYYILAWYGIERYGAVCWRTGWVGHKMHETIFTSLHIT